MFSLANIVNNEKIVKQTKVENTPNVITILMFWKNLPLCMLKPELKTIGGKHT
jgi:hypothetical protein